MLRERARSGYLEVMASPGRTEPESVPIWLKLSEADAAQLDKVLARPEFAGWTKAEWCLEIIQTALRYYAKRPVAEPGRAHAPARPAVTEPESPPPAAEPPPPAPAPEPAAPAPESAAPRPKRAAPKRKPAGRQPRQAAPERKPAAPEPGRGALEPESVPSPARADPDPEQAAPEPELTAAVTAESPLEAECPHPADARDYETGTCVACGAILWD